jgi:hypothetical protein
MRSLFCGTFIVCLGLAATTEVRGDDTAATALLDKAIKAAYGNTDRTKNAGISWKGKGLFQGFGIPAEFTGEWFVQRPDKMKNQIDVDAGGMKITIVTVVNGDKGWRSAMGDVKELTEDELSQSKEELYAGGVAALGDLKDPKFKITTIPEVKADGKTLPGIKVASAGHHDISLYFDDKGLLVKSVRKVKDMMSGQEVDQETIYSNYKDFQGVQRFKKMTIKRDGKDFVELEIEDYKTQDKFPDSTFSKPGE